MLAALDCGSGSDRSGCEEYVMERLVIKFGGTSVMDAERINKAAQIVLEQSAEGVQVVVVVSAMGHATDHLIALAQDVCSKPNARELDLLLATGEQAAASLMTMAIGRHGGRAQCYTGAAAGIVTDDNFGDAHIRRIDPRSLENCLRQGVIPVVAGFQGVTEEGEITTLGRGGSDTTAIALAAFLHAKRCDIYSDVKGVYTADPRLVAEARQLSSISYVEMLELARHGAQILNPRSVQIAIDRGVQVRVRSTFSPEDPGTLVTDHAKQRGHFTSMTCDTKRDCLAVSLGMPTSDSHHLRRFRSSRLHWKNSTVKLFAATGVDVELGNLLKHDPRIMVFGVDKKHADKAKALVLQASNGIRNLSAHVETDLACVSIVSGENNSAIEVEAILTLTRSNIPITFVTRSSHRFSLFVPTSKMHDALNALHNNRVLLAKAA